jgi:hypothetical protein
MGHVQKGAPIELGCGCRAEADNAKARGTPLADSVKYIGLDVHRDTISVAVLDERGRWLMQSVLARRAAAILDCIQRLPGSLQGTFEEGTLYALLVRRVAKLVVCNPRKNALLKRCQCRLKNPRFLALEISSVRCKLRFRIRTGSGRRRTKPVACSPEPPAPSRHSAPRGPAPIPYLSGSYLGCGSGDHSGPRLVLQPVALTLDVDRRGVVQQPVEDGRSNHVVGEDRSSRRSSCSRSG